jgi:hypothetical protein
MHTATPQKVWTNAKSKEGELHIMLRNCKTPRKQVAQSVDYAAIHDERRNVSQFPPTLCTLLQLHTHTTC